MSVDRDVPSENPAQPTAVSRRARWIALGLTGGFVLVLYAWIAGTNRWPANAGHPENAYYNLLVEGFRAGQLSLKTPVPPGLLALPDPYDPIANEPYRLHDASYYRGKFYLYFGVTPALVAFWPYAALTGRHLSHPQAAVMFCAIGFLASATLVVSVARRYFPQAGTLTLTTAVLGVGLANMVPVLLGRADVYEVPIACGYACVMLALLALWRTLRERGPRARWLAAASAAYGLALGARPSLLPGALILFLPVLAAWRDSSEENPRRRRLLLRLACAAVLPIGAIGIALLAYNAARFDTPWEFGQRYQMEGVRLSAMKLFSPAYFWTNVRLYFFQPLRWTADFPFAQGILQPAIPPGHLGFEGAFGALVNLPFLWLSAAALVPAMQFCAADSARALRRLVAAVTLLFAGNAAMLCLFAGACDRYQAEFLPALSVLAALGLLTLERAAPTPPRRTVVRAAGVALLAISAATDWLASYKSSPQAQIVIANTLAESGQPTAAIREYERALKTEPGLPYAHHGLAIALAATGRLPEATAHFRAAIEAKPDFAEAHNGLGVALLRQHDPLAALAEFEAALRMAPRFAEAQFDCAVALLALGRAAEAIPHLEEALRLSPGFPGARERLEAAHRLALPR
jgi:tetratricopeptide (TPR) repeat protein